MAVFNDFREKGNGFSGWMTWGFLCAVTIILFIFQTINKSTKDSARDGANTYTASVSGNRVTVSNHPFAGAVFGFICGVVLSLAAGPIAAPFSIIRTIVRLFKYIGNLKNSV